MPYLLFTGVVHENPQFGSDGESEEGSRHSGDVVSPSSVASAPQGAGAGANGSGAGAYGGVKMRQKAGGPARKVSSQEEINKRLSLPADLKLPENFVEKLAVSPTLDGPLTRATRRQSLSEIGFGKMDTYTKLDKLGEVSESGGEELRRCPLTSRRSTSTSINRGGRRLFQSAAIIQLHAERECVVIRSLCTDMWPGVTSRLKAYVVSLPPFSRKARKKRCLATS